MLKLLLPRKPPICSAAGTLTVARNPGKRPSGPRSCCAICCADQRPVRARRQLHVEHRPARPPPPPTLTISASTYGILPDDVDDLLRVADDLVVRRALRRLEVDVQRVVVGVRDEALRARCRTSPTVAASTASEDDEHRPAMREHQPQAPAVAATQPIERAIHEPREPLLRVHDAQEPAAQHRRERDRDEPGDEHGGRDRHGELAEEPAENAAHEQERDEHRRRARRSS